MPAHRQRAVPQLDGLRGCRFAGAQAREEFGETARLPRLHHPVALLGPAGMQAVVLAAIHRDHRHVPLDRLDRREEAFAVETVGVQLLRRLVGGGDQHHALLEHDAQQAAEQDGVADIADEQLVEAQHPHVPRQLTGQGAQRVGCTGQFELALVHPLHEVVEVLAPRGHAQALVEVVHQPGLAAPHRPPQVDALDRAVAVRLVQGLETTLQRLGGAPLRLVGSETALFHGLAIGGERRRGRQIGRGIGHRAVPPGAERGARRSAKRRVYCARLGLGE